MTERTNIWGLTGCKLPSGKLCDACCEVKAIDSIWGTKTFQKLPHTPCPFMPRDNSRQGCAIHGMAPNGCEAYHCGTEDRDIKRQLIEFAKKSGRVSPIDASIALDRIK